MRVANEFTLKANKYESRVNGHLHDRWNSTPVVIHTICSSEKKIEHEEEEEEEVYRQKKITTTRNIFMS